MTFLLVKKTCITLIIHYSINGIINRSSMSIYHHMVKMLYFECGLPNSNLPSSQCQWVRVFFHHPFDWNMFFIIPLFHCWLHKGKTSQRWYVVKLSFACINVKRVLLNTYFEEKTQFQLTLIGNCSY